MSLEVLQGRSGWGPGVIRGRDSPRGPGRAPSGRWGSGLPHTEALHLSFQEQFCFDLPSNLQLEQESFASSFILMSYNFRGPCVLETRDGFCNLFALSGATAKGFVQLC